MAELDPLINREVERVDGVFRRYVQPSLAEFIGTTLFVFIGCLSAQDGNIVAVGLAHGLTIALLVVVFGKISGGHFNPAVTLGVVIGRGVAPVVGVMYVFSQLTGGILGAAFVRGILPNATYQEIHGGATMLSSDVEPGWAIMAEGILTFLLVSTVLLAAVDERNKTDLAPLAIGFVVLVDIMAGGNVTDASMNPARSLGPAVVFSPFIQSGEPEVWTYHYVYWVGPFLGSLVSAIVYRVLFASGSRRLGSFR